MLMAELCCWALVLCAFEGRMSLRSIANTLE